MLLSPAWLWARLRTYKVRKTGPSLTSSLGLRPKRTESYNVELPSAMRSHGEEPRLQDQKTSQRKRQVGWAGKEPLWTGMGLDRQGSRCQGAKQSRRQGVCRDGLIRHSSLDPPTGQPTAPGHGYPPCLAHSAKQLWASSPGYLLNGHLLILWFYFCYSHISFKKNTE